MLLALACAATGASVAAAQTSPCGVALARACGASRADVFACAECAGSQQEPLHLAGCDNNSIAIWCSGAAVPARAEVVDATSLKGKFMMGFQGWFATPCDGYKIGWSHWSRGNRTPGPDPKLQGFLNFDSWPDMSELDADELCPTNLRYSNGSIAGLYSNANAKTVARFFRWMAAAGVDGVWRQRFLSDVHSPGHRRDFNDKVTQNVAAGASASGRVWAVMYDISGKHIVIPGTFLSFHGLISRLLFRDCL